MTEQTTSSTGQTPDGTPADTPTATPQAILIFRREEFAAKPGSTIRAAIKACGMNPETILATRDGQLITDEVVIRPGDRIKLVATISGG